MIILGLSAHFHDSSAAIIIDGNIVAAAQEERFTRIKHDNSFPINACRFCLEYAGCNITNIDTIVFYEKPLIKFERFIETQILYAPKGWKTFLKAVPIWLKERLNLRDHIRKEFKRSFGFSPLNIKFTEHHLSHAALAYYLSGFTNTGILVIDAVGEWATTSLMEAKNGKIRVIKEQHFPDSIGLLYSSFTYFLGFKVNSDEYKVMGLAPYGNPHSEETLQFISIIENELITIQDDGGLSINNNYFSYTYGLKMINLSKWENLFHIASRKPQSGITQSHRNLAYAIQAVTQKIISRLAVHLRESTGCSNLCIVGGTALNCAVNGFIQDSKIFEHCFVPYSPGDAGGAIGAALTIYHSTHPKQVPNANANPFIGPVYGDTDIESAIVKNKISYTKLESSGLLTQKVACLLAKGAIVAWFQGRMEFGPRALGNRSILADARVQDMKKKINASIKFREEFRPFAPVILQEEADKYFNMPNNDSPYMMFTATAKHLKSDELPAVIHIDNTARVQTITKKDNKLFYNLLSDFHSITGCPVLLNTSFNIMGEPIVCSPEDAIQTFQKSNIDFLIIGNYLITKNR
ncbi:carbamoyltransferase family protein [Bacteroides faecium]|uniref:Carbamoyltransferase n=1 Tax=Bacteroides faecium TaxID=2715212 RepID=A0A6H0KXF6_9BACE|nr:carbamoyltransferase C-terminal domain-containing protein [Bacteroides faecium]QIU97127.1 carbamoyltransferase [Bacteroides faecium]